MPKCMSRDRRRLVRGLIAVATAAALPCRYARAQQLHEDFILAVVNDRAAEVQSGLARGMDPNTVSRDGEPVLLIAARAGNVKTVDVLLAARGINVNARSGVGDTAIMAAAINGELEIIRKLRARGADI